MDARALRSAETDTPLDRAAILAWLREDAPQRLEELWRAADDARRRHVGDAVHLRGLIEICRTTACEPAGTVACGPPIARSSATA